MPEIDLSVLIPARAEPFLRLTVEDVLAQARRSIEVIAVLDGAWADPPLPDDPRLMLIYHGQSIGQRAATNEAARLARGAFVMKLDAHCRVGEGFDDVLLSPYEQATLAADVTSIPLQYNLHAFDWVCHPMGPLALADYIGLDIVCAMAENLYSAFKLYYMKPRETLKKLVKAGQLGRKTQLGFFDYNHKPPVPNAALDR